MNKNIFAILLLISLIASGCTNKELLRTADLPANSSAIDINPSIEGYTRDTEIQTTALAPIAASFTSAVTSIATENPKLGIAAGDYVLNFGKCASRKGLSKVNYYNSKDDILDHAILFVVEENQKKATDCVLEGLGLKPGSVFSVVDIEKSYGVYTLKYSFKTPSGQVFHVSAIATTDKIANALCDKLLGCKRTDIQLQ